MREDKIGDRGDNFKIMTESREEICEQSDRKHPIGGGYDNSVGFLKLTLLAIKLMLSIQIIFWEPSSI